MITDFNDINNLKEVGFQGFKTKEELFKDSSAIPVQDGVYLVLNIDDESPIYLKQEQEAIIKTKTPMLIYLYLRKTGSKAQKSFILVKRQI